jgi:hypothetical protein
VHLDGSVDKSKFRIGRPVEGFTRGQETTGTAALMDLKGGIGMTVAFIQRILGVDVKMAMRVQKMIREAFHEGFDAGHYADPDPTVTRDQDEDNRWNAWRDEER